MRAPSNVFLRSLPLWQRRVPTAVAPLLEESQFGRELTAVLNTTLRSKGSNNTIGLAQLLDAAITTQKIALDSLVKTPHHNIDESDRVAVDLYLENNVEVLDACNHFVDKIEHIKNYVDSLRTVARLGDTGSNKPNATTRAMERLETCQSVVEKRCKVMGGSCLREMLRQKLCQYHENEFSEVMCGSKAMALMCCMFLELGLSFDDSKLGIPSMMKKKSQPTSSYLWLRLLQDLMANQAQGSGMMKKRGSGSALLMNELQQTVIAARELKEQMKGKREEKEMMKSCAERLKICCRKLEDRLVMIEERVKDLYKSLINVRMALLGILSQAHNF